MIGTVQPTSQRNSEYPVFDLAAVPLAAWPAEYALSALPGTPHYQLSPGELLQPPNAYNEAIDITWQAWQDAAAAKLPGAGNGIEGSGGAGSTGSTGSNSGSGGFGASLFGAYVNNPIDTMPDNGQPFHYLRAVDMPIPGTDDFEVVSFFVPDGWIAVIKAVANMYTNNAFQEGSGDITWRIDVDGTYSPGFDQLETTLGSVQNPRHISGAIIATSGQKVRYTISHAAASGLPSGASVKTICSFDGYFVPAL